MIKDWQGHKVDLLTVIGRVPRSESRTKSLEWYCKCDCGSDVVKNSQYLAKERATLGSCGCVNYIRKDFLGKKFDKLTVLGLSDQHVKNRNNGALWACLCDCGKRVTRNTWSLTSPAKSPKSCGCAIQRHSSLIDYTGRVFERLTVKRRVKNSDGGAVRWECLCECGNVTEVQGHNLDRQITKSCGCLKRETTTWNQMLRMGELEPRYIYLAVHPKRKDFYKIGVAKNLQYRTKPSCGGLTIIDSALLPNWETCMLETEILNKSKEHQVFPEDMLNINGISEWRQGEQAVAVWHREIYNHARPTFAS